MKTFMEKPEPLSDHSKLSMGQKALRALARFWCKVKLAGADECWEWIAGKDKDGYGWFKRDRAHRAAWIFFNGRIPEGFLVLHTCDNPPCVNPAHLFLGTQQDNMTDCLKKGRRPSGERHWRFLACPTNSSFCGNQD